MLKTSLPAGCVGLNHKAKFKRKAVVTIIVGAICTDGIVVACDSQTTAGDSKRTDTTKISFLPHGKSKILVAESGDATLSGRAIEILARELERLPFDDYRKPADAAQTAVSKIRKEAVDLNDWENHRNLLDEFIFQHHFSLMLAYYYDGHPYIFTIDSTIGFAKKEAHFAGIGCGATIGEFILGRSGICDMSFTRGLHVAIFTVEEVKKVDPFCGGPTRAAVMSATGRSSSELETVPIIKSAVQAISDFEPELKQNWKELIEKMGKKTGGIYRDFMKGDKI